MKSRVLKDTRAVGLREETGSPSGLIWEEVIKDLIPELSLEGRVERRRALDSMFSAGANTGAKALSKQGGHWD